jgi:hypothetical protein
MNIGALLKALPALLTLVTSLFAKRKEPPRRADSILGDASTPTDSAEAKREADKNADDKFGK